MTAPTFVSRTATAFNSTTSPKTTATIAVQSGDVLVASAGAESDFSTVTTVVNIATASGSTSAWTQQELSPYTSTTTHAYLRTWTATATATGNITVSFTRSATALEFGGIVHVFRNSGGIGAKDFFDNDTAASAPLDTISTTALNSSLVYFSADWNQNTTGGAAAFTSNAGTPVSDLTDQTSAGGAWYYSCHLADAGSIGSKTLGMSAPTGQRFLLSVIEVLGGTATVLLGDYTLDNGLNPLDTACDKIFVCAASPTSYSDATSGTNSLGSKNWGAGAAFGAPAARTGGGRQITSNAITDGSISTAGTVAFWAAVDSANSRLLASGSLTGGKAVTVGQVFTLSAFTIGIPNT